MKFIDTKRKKQNKKHENSLFRQIFKTAKNSLKVVMIKNKRRETKK